MTTKGHSQEWLCCKKTKAAAKWPPFSLGCCVGVGKLEQDAEAHLDLARAADGFGHASEAERRIVERFSLRRKPIEVFILDYIVDGNVEAWRVG
jgi:hypothetical protein